MIAGCGHKAGHARARTQEKAALSGGWECLMVPGEGIEPSLCCQKRILSPSRLPIPPPRPGGGILSVHEAGLSSPSAPEPASELVEPVGDGSAEGVGIGQKCVVALLGRKDMAGCLWARSANIFSQQIGRAHV